MSNKTIPAISIIIPMYNTEKYIGECLDSIFVQTFDDYEIIVVDNCSTDNSAKIVESYIPKFNGKLNLFKLNKHYSCAGIPRNIAIQISRGKYIFCVDSDDMITRTALEELYKISEDFNADVVNCERFYTFSSSEDLKKKLTPTSYKNGIFVEKPTALSNNFLERANSLLNKTFSWNVWSQLIRREFIVKNNLKMMDALGQDMVFTCCLVCSAPNYILVPNIVNFYRIRSDSAYHSSKDDLLKVAEKWIHSLDIGFKYFSEFLSRQSFFQQHSDLKYQVIETVVKEFNYYFIKFYSQIPAYQLDNFIRRELEKIEDKTALTAYLYSRMNIFNVNLLQQQNIIRQQQAQIQQLQSQIQKLQKR